MHGSTIATNTLLEQKGATVGLLTTAGFRDSLETRRGMRDNPWEHRDPGTKVLVPRRLRLPVRGRIDALGNEIASLEIDDVKAAAESFRAQDVESVAICFLNSYANAAHEKATAEATARIRWDSDGFRCRATSRPSSASSSAPRPPSSTHTSRRAQ